MAFKRGQQVKVLKVPEFEFGYAHTVGKVGTIDSDDTGDGWWCVYFPGIDDTYEYKTSELTFANPPAVREGLVEIDMDGDTITQALVDNEDMYNFFLAFVGRRVRVTVEVLD